MQDIELNQTEDFYRGMESKIQFQSTEYARGHRVKMKRSTSQGSGALSFVKDGSIESKGKTTERRSTPDQQNIPTSRVKVKRQTQDSKMLISMVQDLVIFLLYIVVISIIMFGNEDYTHNFYSSVLEDIIADVNFIDSKGGMYTFDTIRSVGHIWEFISAVFLPFLYEHKQNSQPGTSILQESIIVGAPQMRLIRGKSGSCRTSYIFDDLYRSCELYYSEDIEDRQPFGNITGSSWTYHPTGNGRAPYAGRLATYGGGGFIFNFTSDVRFTRYWLSELLTNQWIQKGTKVVFIDFTLYAPNANLFCVIKLVFEVVPSGGIITTSHFNSLKFFRYTNVADHIIFSFEIIFLIFTIYFIYNEIQRLWITKWAYFEEWSNIFGLVVAITPCFVIYFTVVRSVTAINTLKEKFDMIRTTRHPPFDLMLACHNSVNTSVAILFLLVWIKLFTFSPLFKSADLILWTYSETKGTIAMAIAMALLLNVGFALAAFTIFGSYVKSVSTFSTAYFTLLSLNFGQLNFYKECIKVYPILGPLFFTVYILIFTITFLSVFIAVVTFGYQRACANFEYNADRMHLGDVFKEIFFLALKYLRQYDLIRKYRAREIIQQNRNDYDIFVRILKRHGGDNLETRLFLYYHDIHRGDDISLNKLSEVYNDFWARSQLSIEVGGHDEIKEHTDKLHRLIEYCDQIAADILTKADVLADKIVQGKRST